MLTETPLNTASAAGGDTTASALLSDVDAFLSYIAIVRTPDVDAVRERIERSLRNARSELLAALQGAYSGGPRHPAARAQATWFPAASAWVAKRPWIAIAAAALLGAAIGISVRRSAHEAR